MAKFASPDVLDGGLLVIKNSCNKMALISAYTIGDSYAIVNAAILADVVMAATDFTIAASGNNRTLTSAAGKSDASVNATGGSATNHIAFLDTVGLRVLWVTTETSGQVVTAGNAANFPSLVYTSNQPT